MRVVLHTAMFPGDTLTMTPLGIGYIYSFLQKKLGTHNIHLKIALNVEDAIAFCPDIVAIGAVSHVIDEAICFAITCRKELPNCVTILGGYHITALPHKLPTEFNIGVIGEGEETMLELLSVISKHGVNKNYLRNVSGIVFHDDAVPCITSKRCLISDLDELPAPYRVPGIEKEAPIFTTRGCPYRCTFCASHNFWRDKYRKRSAKSVIEEIMLLAENPNTKEIVILDDLWMADKSRFREIANGLIKYKINEKVTFQGFCRSNIIDKQDILLLKQMNYSFVRFGAETGSERLLKRLKGPEIAIEDHQRLIDICAECNMPCAGAFMFGTPGETLEDIKQTICFLRKNKGKLSISGFYLFNPIPGTELWTLLEEKGLVHDDLPFNKYRLDMNRLNFNWDDFYYWNEDSVPRHIFKKYMVQIKAEFISPQSTTTSLNSRFTSRVMRKFHKILGR